MARARKTVEVDRLLDYANGYLSADYVNGDKPEEIARRQGLCDMLEAALHSIGRYRGFSFLDETQLTMSKPGIRWDKDMMGRFTDTDATRRRYA
jgi:hypothetical protein